MVVSHIPPRPGRPLLLPAWPLTPLYSTLLYSTLLYHSFFLYNHHFLISIFIDNDHHRLSVVSNVQWLIPLNNRSYINISSSLSSVFRRHHHHHQHLRSSTNILTPLKFLPLHFFFPASIIHPSTYSLLLFSLNVIVCTGELGM
jgi:hypothetical protein